MTCFRRYHSMTTNAQLRSRHPKDMKYQSKSWNKLSGKSDLQKKKRPRPFRFNVTEKDEEHFLIIGGRELEILNYSQSGIAVLSEDPFGHLDGVWEAHFSIGGKAQEKIKVKMVREEKLPSGKFKIAFSLWGKPLNTRKLRMMMRNK